MCLVSMIAHHTYKIKKITISILKYRLVCMLFDFVTLYSNLIHIYY